MDVSRTDILRASDDVLAKLSQGERLRLSREAERELGRRSTYYLTREILGYDRLVPRFHLRLANFYDKWIYHSQFHLHPRKHFKTTILTVGGSIRLILLNPNIAICLIFNVLSNSKDTLVETKEHFISNPKFRDLYPEHAVDRGRDEGTQDKFTTPARTKPWIRTHTLEAFSAEKAIVSRHYDLLKFDDVVDNLNVQTPELRRKTYENYVKSLATAGRTKQKLPWHHMVGTRWSFNDLYQSEMEKPSFKTKFKALITQAKWKETGPNGGTITKYLFPEEFSEEYLESLRTDMGDYLFSCLYYNNPMPDGASSLDPKYLQFYSPEEKKKGERNRVITVDPAASTDIRHGDPSCIGVYEVDEYSNIYILEVNYLFCNPDELIDRIVDTHKLYRIRDIGVEHVSLSKWLSFYLERVKKEQYLRFRLIPIKRSTAIRKEKRHERIIPYLRNKKIYVREDEPSLDIIRRELREYPLGKHDHFLDTLTDAIEIVKPPSKATKRDVQDFRMPPHVIKSRSGFQTGYSVRSR